MISPRINQSASEDSLRFIVITEGLAGHRLRWLEKLTELVGRVNQPLQVITLPESQNSFSDKLKSQIHLDLVDFIYVDNRDSLFPAAEALSPLDPQLRFVIWDADDWAIELLNTPIPFRALAMRPYLTEIKFRPIIRFVIKNFLYSLINLRRTGELAKLSVPLARTIFCKKHWLQDDLTLREVGISAPEGKSLANPKGKTLLIPGFITSRKRPGLAIKVVHALNSVDSNDWQLIFTGKIDSQCAAVIHRERGDQVKVFDEYLDDSKYEEILASADIVLLLYKNRGASGIAVESCVLGTPVVMAYSRLWKGVERQLPRKFRMVHLRVEKIVNVVLELSKEPRSELNDPWAVREILKLTDPKDGITQFFVN